MADGSIGMVGLGLLGTALAERLLAAGFDLYGFDVDKSRRHHMQKLTGHATASARDVAAGCRRIVLSLPDSDVSQMVVEEMSPVLQAGSIVIDTTTGDPQKMAAIAASLVEREVQYIDATVAGSSQQAREGDVVVIVGGPADSFSACRDLFDSFARKSFHVGPVGSGARMKLVVNLVLGLNRAVLAEGLAFARAAGFNLDKTLTILQAGPAWSRVMETKGHKMVEEEFTPQARLAQHLKDVKLILAEGGKTGARLPLSDLHRTLLERLEDAGYGDRDNSAIIKAFQ